MDVKLRPPTADDAETCGRIIYEAFRTIATRHNFPPDFPSAETGVGIAVHFIANPAIYGVLAEKAGRVVGSNFLDERGSVRGVGPITVDPEAQGKGVGRRLMEAVIARGRGAAGIRLVQDAFNTRSMSLYTSLGFDPIEPLALVRGKPRSAPRRDLEVRPLAAGDLEACADLCARVHGFSREGELSDARAHFDPFVALRGGRVVAYASAATYWVVNHAVAETEEDLEGLLLGAAALSERPLFLLAPIRRAGFFRWCLAEGLRVVKPMTLMAMGPYREPAGAFYPSVGF
jgi:GNAT superfamily N-acetyltransferase